MTDSNSRDMAVAQASRNAGLEDAAQLLERAAARFKAMSVSALKVRSGGLRTADRFNDKCELLLAQAHAVRALKLLG